MPTAKLLTMITNEVDSKVRGHKKGETVEILRKVTRQAGDTNPLVFVKFEDGSKGTVLQNDIEEDNA